MKKILIKYGFTLIDNSSIHLLPFLRYTAKKNPKFNHSFWRIELGWFFSSSLFIQKEITIEELPQNEGTPLPSMSLTSFPKK